MKINFTKEQYETLLKAVYLGNWMFNSIDDNPEKNAFDEIEEHLCAFAKDFGLEEYVEHDQKDKTFYPSRALEEDKEVSEAIDRYDDYTFWDKLISSLAARDVFNKHGEEKFDKLSEKEFFVEEQSFAEKYEKEFAKNGVKNLTMPRGK